MAEPLQVRSGVGLGGRGKRREDPVARFESLICVSRDHRAESEAVAKSLQPRVDIDERGGLVVAAVTESGCHPSNARPFGTSRQADLVGVIQHFFPLSLSSHHKHLQR